MWPNPQESADLVTFSEEVLNGKLHFLCNASISFGKTKVSGITKSPGKLLSERGFEYVWIVVEELVR